MPSDHDQHRPLMRLLLRVLGVYCLLEGVAGVVAYGITLAHQYRETRREFFGPFEYIPFDAHSLGWTIGSAILLAAGLYLLFGGRMILDAVFHESIDGKRDTEGTP